MIIGTAGHIDHGKTALVKALTGVDADRLREEKARGLTIDLGYAYKPLASGEILGFVDVPGHERFVHNMLAGATGIDYVLLVVAADDGVMPQTREHVAILHLLGLARGVVALTKTDLASNARLTEVSAQIRALLQDTSLSGAPVMPVSSISGEGIAQLADHLYAAAGELPARSTGGHFRLAVDRSFTLAGAGVVVTGTVFSGCVQVGDRLTISPSGLPVRVRSIHAQNRTAQNGRVGQRCALNLSGAQIEKGAIRRGDWILADAVHAPSARLDARLNVLSTESRPLRHWTPVHVHLGASDINGRIAVLESQRIEPGGSGWVQLVLAHPVGALHGDRFIVRDQSAWRTLGGGFVLDPFPPMRGRRKPQRLRALAALNQSAPAESLRALLAERAADGVDLDRFALTYNLPPADAARVFKEIELVRLTAGDRTLGYARENWRILLDEIVQALTGLHRQFTDRPGVGAEELRKSLSVNLPKPVFAAAAEDLITDRRIVRAGALLQQPGHEARLSDTELKLRDRILPILRDGGIRPPRVRELASQLRVNEKPLRQLLRRLAKQGELHQLSEELYLTARTVTRLAAETQRLFEKNPDGTLTVKEFRQHTGVGRNVVFEVLEFFDRAGFTLRAGDGRRLRRDCTKVFGAPDT